MKNLLHFIKIFALSVTLMFISCEADQSLVEQDIETGIDQEILSKIANFSLNSNVVRAGTLEYPDGTSQKGFYVEDDIFMTETQIRNSDISGGITTEQYRTNNLVSSPRTISVIGYTGGRFALSRINRTGLQRAINNYNALNLDIRFTLRFARSTNADIVVHNDPNATGSGGSAGFPSRGAPNRFVRVHNLNNFSADVNEHVITHEIGHSIGFRHTDFFSRQSCGGPNSNEGTAGVGAVQIPGTPSGFDPTSIMLACFSNGVNGEFNNNDITALRFLY